MAENRREFLKKAAMLGGGIGVWSLLPASLQKALAINPELGSTFYDADHVVFLMQENRSFDHCFGTLQGVRGYHDPRVIDLPNKNKVWLQQNAKGETFSPLHLNMKDTRATWMGGLPHSWADQVDARNGGKYDNWLIAKSAGKSLESMPMALGYYTREDIPFYYAFADSFTVCDQHFCSSLTGTTSNRMFFWTGAIKDKPGSPAWVRNSDIGYQKEVSWKTFPERLEENGISWKVYQNELSVTTELGGEDEALLSNFTNNNLEWFSQYNVRFSSGHYQYLIKRIPHLEKRITELVEEIKIKKDNEKLKEELADSIQKLVSTKKEAAKWSPENFEKLSDVQKNLHNKGLCTNHNDKHYHETETINYTDKEGKERSLKVPKGDIFHEFRKDVKGGTLPTVSWLVAPQYFSDHPSAPWYGAWYVSETLDILTENPEVWKKTIFILNYDENDGYFDHVPPFVAPNPLDPDSGKTSDGLDSSDEFVTLKEELAKPGMNPKDARESPVGLGYRVPLIIASPWSRGGWVNSEICDITSTLLFMEKFLNKKFGKNIKEENINSWRRAICGDLTSTFRPYHGEEIKLPKPVERDSFMKSIHDAKFKGLPTNFKALDKNEIAEFNADPRKSPYLPKQEKGIRNANALPYELYVHEKLDAAQDVFKLKFCSSDTLFKANTAGAAFSVYAPGKYWQKNSKGTDELLPVKTWDIAVASVSCVDYEWPLSKFDNNEYHLRVYGPNGFYREYQGNKQSYLSVQSAYSFSKDLKEAYLEITIKNSHPKLAKEFTLENTIYDSQVIKQTIKAQKEKTIKIAVGRNFNWYDLSIEETGNDHFLRRLAGHIENGKPSKTDPLMGGMINK